MGCYINPPDMPKEEWLRKHGSWTGERPCPITPEFLPVCLVDNGPFTAAGVAFDEDEREAFNSPTDTRWREWYKVSRELLRTVSPLALYEKTEKAE